MATVNSLFSVGSFIKSFIQESNLTQTQVVGKREKETFSYILFHLCFLGEDGGYKNAVEASSQYTNHKQVEEEADEVNPTFLFAGAICNFLFDPLFFQISLESKNNNYIRPDSGRFNYSIHTLLTLTVLSASVSIMGVELF